jgi:hypothetical protein
MPRRSEIRIYLQLLPRHAVVSVRGLRHQNVLRVVAECILYAANGVLRGIRGCAEPGCVSNRDAHSFFSILLVRGCARAEGEANWLTTSLLCWAKEQSICRSGDYASSAQPQITLAI